jgi:hypothetical protein
MYVWLNTFQTWFILHSVAVSENWRAHSYLHMTLGSTSELQQVGGY